MFKKLLLIGVIVASVSWLGYVAYDIVNRANDFNPYALFGEEDGSVLLVLNNAEVNIDQIEEFKSAPISRLANKLNGESFDLAYFSLIRNQLLLKKKEGWTSENIAKCLGNDVVLHGDKITLGNYHGQFHRQFLYLSSEEYPLNTNLSSEYKNDVKASAAIVRFGADNKVVAITDIYNNHNGTFEYVSKNQEGLIGRKVSDEKIFSGLLTRNFDSYTFYERDFLASQDTVFANGPMFQWMLNGLVILEYKGSTVYVSDYVPGQDPIMVLSDRTQVFDTTVFKIPLTNDFDGKAPYFVDYLEDLVVLGKSKSAVEKVIADYKLGQTIALSQSVKNKLFGNLPEEVSFRKVDSENNVAKSVYHSKIMETRAGVSLPESDIKAPKESLSMGGDHSIVDFVAFEGDGNVIALSEEGYITRYVKENKKWEHQIEGDNKGGLQLIDLHGDGSNYTLINTKDRIYLFDLDGNSPTGFPIQLEEDAVNQVKFYRWKGKSYFLVGTSNSEIIHFDAHGRELDILKAGLIARDQINVWASNSRLFCGYRSEDRFVMYDMDKKRVHREFAISGNAIPLKVPNELLHFGIQGNQLVGWDQKGVLSKFEQLTNPKILSIYADNLPVIVVQDGNTIHLYNMQGLPLNTIRLPFNEVESVSVYEANSGKTYCAVLDGLENNVYLYDSNGSLLTQKGLEGQGKVDVLVKKGSIRVTTIVDQFVVQYFEN